MMMKGRQFVAESEYSLVKEEYHPKRSKQMDNEAPCL